MPIVSTCRRKIKKKKNLTNKDYDALHTYKRFHTRPSLLYILFWRLLFSFISQSINEEPSPISNLLFCLIHINRECAKSSSSLSSNKTKLIWLVLIARWLNSFNASLDKNKLKLKHEGFEFHKNAKFEFSNILSKKLCKENEESKFYNFKHTQNLLPHKNKSNHKKYHNAQCQIRIFCVIFFFHSFIDYF